MNAINHATLCRNYRSPAQRRENMDSEPPSLAATEERLATIGADDVGARRYPVPGLLTDRIAEMSNTGLLADVYAVN